MSRTRKYKWYSPEFKRAAEQVRVNWGWLMVIGIAMVVLGFIEFYMIWAFTLVSMVYFGIMVLAGGPLLLIDAFKAETWKAKLMEILIALVYLLAGLVMIFNPAETARLQAPPDNRIR